MAHVTTLDVPVLDLREYCSQQVVFAALRNYYGIAPRRPNVPIDHHGPPRRWPVMLGSSIVVGCFRH